jgi:hypothetical protein
VRIITHRLAWLLAVALICLVAAASGAAAQSNVEMARSWGLLGTWRLDCGEPKSRENPDFKYVGFTSTALLSFNRADERPSGP